MLTEQAKDSGEPAPVIEKMVEGRLRKFYEEVVLLQQAFVHDPETTVAKALAATEQAAGTPIDHGLPSFLPRRRHRPGRQRFRGGSRRCGLGVLKAARGDLDGPATETQPRGRSVCKETRLMAAPRTGRSPNYRQSW